MALSPPRGVMPGSSDAPPAGLRPAMPTGGRRSLAAGAICANGGVSTPRRHAGEQRCAARWPAASCADRRSAFPGGRGHLHEWRCLCLAASCGGAAMRRPLACGQLCRPEVARRRRADDVDPTHPHESQARERRPLVGTARRRRAGDGNPTHPHESQARERRPPVGTARRRRAGDGKPHPPSQPATAETAYRRPA